MYKFSLINITIDTNNTDYKTRIEMEFINMTRSKFEVLKNELREAIANVLKVPVTTIECTLKNTLVKRSIIQDDFTNDSTIVVVTVRTTAPQAAMSVKALMNSASFVQKINDEITNSETLRNSGIALERVTAAFTETYKSKYNQFLSSS